MTLSDDLSHGECLSRHADLERDVAAARRDRDAARHALRESETQNSDLLSRLSLLEAVEDLNPQPPKWLAPKKTKTAHQATVVAMLSDCHFDEVVNPDEVGGTNAYNRDIASFRLRRFFDKTIEMSRDYLAGVSYDGMVLLLGGDMISGDIHEELSQTNEDTVLGTLLHYSELIAAGVSELADTFGNIHIASVVGNHGRRTRKPRAKLRARDNFDWLLAHMVRRLVPADNVTWEIPEEADARVSVYDTNILLTHGDQFRGGTGMAGIASPIGRGQAKKAAREQAAGQRMDHMVLGHWHQLKFETLYTVNGALKGVDEYAWQGNFGLEPPQQAMFLVTPEHGITIRCPILVGDKSQEGW